MKNTAKEKGYTFVKWLGYGFAVFKEDGGNLEIWASNPDHASFGFHYNNTDWEFCREYDGEEKAEYMKGFKIVRSLAKMEW